MKYKGMNKDKYWIQENLRFSRIEGRYLNALMSYYKGKEGLQDVLPNWHVQLDLDFRFGVAGALGDIILIIRFQCF